MNKTRFLVILSVVLVVCNLVLITALILGKPGHPPHRHDNKKEYIIEKLHFDEKQCESYVKLIDSHKSGLQIKHEEILQLKKELYSTLSSKNFSENHSEIIATIGDVQEEIDEINYQHFVDIRNLCREDQLDDFDDLTLELAELFQHKKPAPPKK